MRSRHVALSICLALGAVSGACSSPIPGKALPAPQPAAVPSSRPVFRSDAVKRGVTQILKEEYKISDVGEVTCPDGQFAEPQAFFFCTVEVGGKVKSVKIVVKTVDGEYEVGQPVG